MEKQSMSESVKGGAVLGAMAGATMAIHGNPLLPATLGAAVGALSGAVAGIRGRKNNFHDSASQHGQETFKKQSDWSKDI
jgi:uncharacterized membrane protein